MNERKFITGYVNGNLITNTFRACITDDFSWFEGLNNSETQEFYNYIKVNVKRKFKKKLEYFAVKNIYSDGYCVFIEFTYSDKGLVAVEEDKLCDTVLDVVEEEFSI